MLGNNNTDRFITNFTSLSEGDDRFKRFGVGAAASGNALLEDGTDLLLEDNTNLLYEG